MVLDTHLQLPLKKSNVRVLHITDTHLFANENGTLLGINSNASFLAVMNEIENRQQHFDLIVATGDFVQDGSKEGYQRFAQRVVQLNIPCVYLAGNHDVTPYMDNVFQTYNIANHKVILCGEKWLIVLLNSQVVGQAYGYLAPSELTFLQTILHTYADRFVLVFLHHHPIMSGCKWLDEHALKNSDELTAILQANPHIKGIGWGHIHQQQDRLWHHCNAFATPATCVQFKSNCDNFMASNQDMPGWREITLFQQGEIESHVFRIKTKLFLPDMSQTGY